jgi:hypothetical protein
MAEQSWTNDPITTQPRIIKKSVHFIELQDAINAWETAYSIGNTNYTDSPASQVIIKDTVITEMQDALDALYQLTDSTSFIWTERPDNTYRIKPVHVNDLRTHMNWMQHNRCYQCDLCDTEGCTCDSVCDSDSCDLCYGHSYGFCTCENCHQETCTCDGPCYQEGKTCTVCNATCYEEGCTCDFGCYPDVCLCNTACYGDVCSQCDASCYEENCVKCYVANYRYPWT